MNFHSMTQKNLFDSYVGPSPMISRCYSTKANAFTNLPGNPLYLGDMRHFSKKNTPFGPGHLKMPPLEHRADFCDPLVKIVGGFVGSKSQAGTTNHRGREFSLWDVIVDKIIDTMENPEPRQQTSRKSDTNGKKNCKIQSFTMMVGQYSPDSPAGPNFVDKIIQTIENPESRLRGTSRQSKETNDKEKCKIHKIESFTMIGVGQYGPECVVGPNFDCLGNECYPPSNPGFVESVCVHNDFPDMGVFHTSNFSGAETGPHPINPGSETEFMYETDIAAFCMGIDRPSQRVEDEPTCQIHRHSPPVSEQAAPSTISCIPSNCLPINPEGSGENVESTLPCSFESFPELPYKTVQSTKSSFPEPALNCAGAAPKHILRPEAVEFTPRLSCQIRPSLESESEDDGIPVDLLSSSCESQTPSDTFLRPKVLRTLSECSVDSDDSFIVFESAEDDPVILSEDSDGEESCSDEDLDEIDNPILFPHNLEFSQPPPVLSRLEEANKKWAENYSGVNLKDSDSANKKVKFAEGNNLVKVKHLIAWDFAHRAARIGPWEMYHRDSERFKSRITSLSAILSPVLTKRHREKIYKERFQT